METVVQLLPIKPLSIVPTNLLKICEFTIPTIIVYEW